MNNRYNEEILTKEELLFLHLLMNNSNRDRYVVSEMITEHGIKNALHCDLSLISRLLKKNEKRGLIYRILLKIENKKRKQNAFFLTEEGLNYAIQLSKLNSIVEYDNQKNGLRKDPIGIKNSEAF